jgi:hypothetical protein
MKQETEARVARHYTHGDLERTVLDAQASAVDLPFADATSMALT